MESPVTYIPMDRRQTIAGGKGLPDRTSGAALFADISGFTPLTETLVRELGPQRGADELTRQLNFVYDALIAEVHRFRGSVIGFSGDAITCWFDDDPSISPSWTGQAGLRATACAMAMQQVIGQFANVETPSGLSVSLAIKVAVTTGPVRRFLVGDPEIQTIDVLAGATLDRMAEAEHHAQKGEVVVGPETVAQLGDRVEIAGWRGEVEAGGRFAIVGGLTCQVETDPWLDPLLDEEGKTLTEEQMRSWLLPPVYERLKTGQGRFLAELRPGVALFLRFGGLDYDEDEAAGEKLDRYLRWVQNVLARYEGYMFQLTLGDKGCYLYGAFGAPLAHDDDPARAVAAAIELRSPPPEMDFITGVQIGISQGRMRVGAYGGSMRRTYGMLGAEVNVAARLMSKAEPGQILISQRIADAVARGCQLESIGLVIVKGMQKHFHVYAVAGRQLTFSQRLTTLFVHPLVGRDDELAQMTQLLEPALVGEGQILRLEGEAGVGKSHLAAEFIEHTAGRGFRVATGICQSTGQAIPYFPWRQVFRTLFELTDEPATDEDPISWAARQIAQVEAMVHQTNPDWFPRLPLLGDLLGLPIPDTATTAAFDPKVRQQALFALAVEIVQTRAQAQPLLLLFEDMRWMDEASLELMLSLGRSIAHAPVLLVLAHRPPVLLPDLNRMPYYHHLDLSELSPQGVAALVTNRLQGQPSALALSLIQAMAQGNPFFTEELVDTLRESGALCREDSIWLLSPAIVNALREASCLARSEEAEEEGQWTLVPNAPLAAADLGIPDSIHGVVLSRLDRLPEGHKLSLKVASVIGRIFEFDLLAWSHPVRPAREALLGQVKEMEVRDFTRLEVPPPQLIYMFKHNITQEVVHGTLLEDQRRELHRAIGEALERLLPEAVERLAHHYFEGQVWAKALAYNLQVARHAQREFANDIAVAAYQRALEAATKVDVDTSREQLLARESLGEVLTLVGRYDEALEHYALARELVEAETPSAKQMHHLADLCHKTAEVYERRSEYDTAFEWLGKGLGYLDEDEPSIEAARIYTLQAGVYRRQGKYDEAVDWCQKSLTTASEIKTREGQQTVAHAYYNLGGIYIRRGDLQRGVRFSRESIAAYQQIDDIAGQSKAYNILGYAYERLDWDQASDAFHRSLAIRREIGDIQGQGFGTNNLGNIYLYRGEWAEAAALYEESSTIWRQLGAALPEAVTLSNLAQVHICWENWSEARTCLSRSQAIFARIGSESYLPELERRWGRFYLKTGALDQALDHIRRSIELAVAQNARLEEGASRRVLGQVHLARGERELAETVLCQSLQILSDLNSEYEAAKTMVPLACLMLEENSMEAQAHLEQAIPTFKKLGAQADLVEALALRRQLEL